MNSLPHTKKENNNKDMSLPSLREIPGTKTNPFMFSLKEKLYLQPRANTIIAKGEQLINKETGEILKDNVLLGKRKIVDKSQFAKIYASEVGLLFNLSKAAINVFIYLTSVMDYEQKSIFEYTKDYKSCGYNTYKQCLVGLRELIMNDIIYPHSLTGIWWINPAIVCKGERFAKYTEFVTKDFVIREEKKLKEQGRLLFDSLDEETTNKLDAMNAVLGDTTNITSDNEIYTENDY